ncbi:MAG: fumarylacetoacetate hydrolase family protein [Thermotogota bacterium]
MNNQPLQVNRIFCVGRNYINHAKELKNQIPESPVVFMKPTSCLVHHDCKYINLSNTRYEVHYESELVIQVGKSGFFKDGDVIDGFIHGFTLGLDLTLRQLQKQLKEKGLPWEKSKSFDHSSPLGKIIPINSCNELKDFNFDCLINNEKRQHGQVKDMIFSFEEILKEISNYWKLLAGDLIYTGTPEGVGVLKTGDIIRIESQETGAFEWKIS